MKCSQYIYGFLCMFLSFQVMLVSGSKVPERWVVPGGGIEPSEDTCVAALREVQEEAGVKGTLGRLLGVFEVMPNQCARSTVKSVIYNHKLIHQCRLLR